MSGVISLRDLKDTILWKKLDYYSREKNDSAAKFFSAILPEICGEASARMKRMLSLHEQFTLHDETHLLRVTELMAKVMPERVLESLNSVEIALLILSAYFHDQGMVLDKEELRAIESDPNFKVFSENWAIDHPNLNEIRDALKDKNLGDEEKSRIRHMEQDLLQGLLTDYIRRDHAHRSGDFVRSNYHDNSLWKFEETNIAPYVAKLCESHGQNIIDLIPEKGFNFDESLGRFNVNLSYLALVLRLADTLDFDRDRTPDSLYKTINFTNDVSLIEWEKHRSVEGWNIDPNLIRFTMQCERPEYQRAALNFMDKIDAELDAVIKLTRSYPKEFASYFFDFPTSVDRTRIYAKNDSYIYHDLEFSLSRNEIVKLLMTDNLYNSSALCVRELLQNSLDALRYRKSLIKLNGSEWSEGKVILEHELNEYGHEIFRCTDNGVGMDEHIIENFLTKVGRSFYRSPEFEQERLKFEKKNVDFDPCSQFGIGFMSCFMIGDRINIKTRRDYGPAIGWGVPLKVEINGLSGMVVIRKGSLDQIPGTVVEIIGRKKPSFFDEWTDTVNLIGVVSGYALACEFPIEAHCRIDEIKDNIIIPARIESPQTSMEKNNIKNILILEQEFSEIDPNLRGIIRESFLLNESGKIVLSNNEAKWIIGEYCPQLFSSNDKEIKESSNKGAICLDGIYVCGDPDYNDKNYHRSFTTWSNNWIPLDEDYYLLDIRGSLKPPLSPSREPPRSDYSIHPPPKWVRLAHMGLKGRGMIWEHLAELIGDKLDDEMFWRLALIHRAPISWMNSVSIWKNLSVPALREGKKIEWKKISSLENLSPRAISPPVKGPIYNSFEFYIDDHLKISCPEELARWGHPSRHYGSLGELLYELIIGISTVKILNGEPILALSEPTQEEIVMEHRLDSIFLLKYLNVPESTISIDLPFETANRNHPLVQTAFNARYLEHASEIESFARSLVFFLAAGPKRWNDRWKCYIGSLYSSIDWHNYPRLSAPYTTWLNNQEQIQITEDQLKSWATIKLGKNAK